MRISSSLRRLAASLAFLATLGTARADLAHRRSAVVEVVEKVSPAVVYIGTEQQVETRFRGSPSQEFYDDLFGNRRERTQTVQSLGSGVIIDPSGIIVTNDHVIRGASAIHVTLADGRRLEAEVLGSDADNDLAVLRVQSKSPLPTARLGTSSDLMIGETVVAIGSPFGLAKTVTSGVVSAVNRSFKANGRVYNDFVQTDAAINPGNSGGPLLNADGDIIGINSAIYASAQGIGFAIPADKVRRIVEELKHFGKLRLAWVGIDARNLGRTAAGGLGWDRNYGVLVASVDPGSPAERAGVQRGDILTEMQGAQVTDAEDFNVRLRGFPARASFTLALIREGKPVSTTVTPVEFPPKLAEGLAWERLGLKLRDGRRGLAITSVRPGSEADRIGLEPGDLVLRLNTQVLGSLDTFREAILSARSSKSVLLLIQRGHLGYYLTLPF